MSRNRAEKERKQLQAHINTFPLVIKDVQNQNIQWKSYVWTAELTAKKHTAGWAGQGAHVPNTFIYHWKQTLTGNSENGNQNSELTFSPKQACSKNFPIVCPLFHIQVPLASEKLSTPFLHFWFHREKKPLFLWCSLEIAYYLGCKSSHRSNYCRSLELPALTLWYQCNP